MMGRARRAVGARGRLAIGAAALALALVAPAGAAAQFGVTSESWSVDGPGGIFLRQAGAHPDLTLNLTFAKRPGANPGEEELDGNVRDVVASLPPGFVGNPTAVSTCVLEDIGGVEGSGGAAACPPASQVGVVNFVTNAEGTSRPTAPLFNVKPEPGQPAQFAFNYLGAIVRITASVNPGDYTISTRTAGVPQALPIYELEVKFWGVPADPSHDAERGGPLLGARPTPFLSLPTSCPGSPFAITTLIDSWAEPGRILTAAISGDSEGVPFTVEGCAESPFAPSLSIRPEERTAEAPTGLDFDLVVPQGQTARGLATAHVRDVTVELPEGVSVSPSGADGLGACGQAQVGLGSNAPAACPASSTLADVTIATPLLAQPLSGHLYLATPRQNPFGTLLAAYLVAEGSGVAIKLPGRIDADPASGRLSVSFADAPQLPFGDLHVAVRGGPRAPLATPGRCGAYASRGRLVSWASTTPVALESTFAIDRGCGGGFDPKLRAGTVDPAAGRYSDFVLQVTRGDGEAALSRLAATLPEGLLAKLAGVPLCGDAAAAVGACPAGSRVGAVTVGVGPGSDPFYLPAAGRAPTAVFLGGPYKGAPYSLVIAVPAQAGPFDLGTVVVRSALRVDPTTTRVTAESDPLPQILEGIPISYRDLRVRLDRPRFALNPTSCAASAVTSTLTSTGGATASPRSSFTATDCGKLGFEPRLGLSLKGQTKRGGNPALTAVLRKKAGEANIAETSVVLPRSFFIDNAHISNPCTRVQFDADKCPKSSILGTAVARTPLLDKPLRGPVYFRSNGGARELPDLVADLGGQIHVTLVGFIDSVKVGREGSRVRTRFANVPDAPVSKFVLRLKGGKRGLIENSQDLCASTQRAKVAFVGQNGKRTGANRKIATNCHQGGKR